MMPIGVPWFSKIITSMAINVSLNIPVLKSLFLAAFYTLFRLFPFRRFGNIAKSDY